LRNATTEELIAARLSLTSKMLVTESAIVRMQAELNEMKEQLRRLDGGEAQAVSAVRVGPRRGRPPQPAKAARAKGGGNTGWSADPEERKAEIARRRAVAAERQVAKNKSAAGQKGAASKWAAMTKKEQDAHIAKMTKARKKARKARANGALMAPTVRMARNAETIQ